MAPPASAATPPPARSRLIESAARLMAEKGFDGVSVREICADAGTGSNMVHHYFGSKRGLLDEIVEQFGSGVFALPLKLLDRHPRSRDEFVSLVELLFETTLDAYIEHRAVLLVVVREQADPEALPHFMDRFAAFLEQAKQAGFVRAEVDIEMTIGFLHDRLISQVQLAPWIKRNYGTDILTDDEYKRRWCRSNLDIFLHGLVPAP